MCIFNNFFDYIRLKFHIIPNFEANINKMKISNLVFFISFVAIILFGQNRVWSANSNPAENYIVLESNMNVKFPDSSDLKLPFDHDGDVKFFKVIGNSLVTVIDIFDKDSVITRSFVFTDIKTKKNTISSGLVRRLSKYPAPRRGKFQVTGHE